MNNRVCIITGDLEMRSFLKISLKAVITFGDNIGDNICLHENRKTARNALFSQAFRAVFVTGDERIELPLRVLETPVMPFDQSPTDT